MKKSITYHLVLWVLKQKGIKKVFSQNPINYKALRKDDVHTPAGNFYRQNHVSRFPVLETNITELRQDSDTLLIFIHGGAFVSGPAQHHWDTAKTIYAHTKHTIWLCDYPKAPEKNIVEISQNIDEVFSLALKKYNPENIKIIGDSVGGTIAISLVQRIVRSKGAIPSKLILISPVVDATLQNPSIDTIDKTDPMLSKKGVLSAKQMCAGQISLTDSSISPLFGELTHFPPTFLFLAENDITYPDQELFVEKLKQQHVPHTVYIGHGMPHIWPLLPIMKEAKTALSQIIKILGGE